MSRAYCSSGGPFLYTGGESGSGMDCLQHRQSAGPFHYLINEQAKSLVALQELQNEVGALLEFRDLVIETFPNLRTKLHHAHSTPATMTTSTALLLSTTSSSSSPHTSSNIPVAVRRDWEPGVRVRRKIIATGKDDLRNGHHLQAGANKKSAETAVQDSGFSTEASSKETHSASSTAPPAPSSGTQEIDGEDELWNLLDVIHRKGTRLRDELEALQDAISEGKERRDHEPDFERVLLHASVDDVRQLKRERDLLMDRVAEMEAEVLAGRMHTSRLQDDLEHLLLAKQDLEEQLRAVMTQSGEVNTRIHDLHTQFVTKTVTEQGGASGDGGAKVIKVAGTETGTTKPSGSSQRTRRRTSRSVLDSVLGDEVPQVKSPDGRKITAILTEYDPIVLQKHLLNSTVRNQVLQEQLDAAAKMEEGLVDQLGRAREENDDLRFQLEDKNIDLEGTKARVRMLEQRQRPNTNVSSSSPDIIPNVDTASDHLDHRSRSEITTASMKAMSPLPMNLLQLDHSSSTESAHDQAESVRRNEKRKSSSRIPLMKSYAAPKPPASGSNRHGQGPASGARSRSGDSLGRPHSAQSLRKVGSDGNSLKSSSSLSKSLHKDSLTGGRVSLTKGPRDYSINSSMTSGRGGGVGGGGGGQRKSSTASIRRAVSIRDSPEAKMNNSESAKENAAYRWMLSSYNSDSIEFYSDSLDLNASSDASSPQQLLTIDTSSSNNRYQTANTFVWSVGAPLQPTEFYDSIDSNLISSLYQPNGEQLAECDSLEKH